MTDSFVCMLISPLCLVIMYKKQKNFEVKMRLRGLKKHANKRIIYWPPFWNKVHELHLKTQLCDSMIISRLFQVVWVAKCVRANWCEQFRDGPKKIENLSPNVHIVHPIAKWVISGCGKN